MSYGKNYNYEDNGFYGMENDDLFGKADGDLAWEEYCRKAWPIFYKYLGKHWDGLEELSTEEIEKRLFLYSEEVKYVALSEEEREKHMKEFREKHGL